MFPPKFLVLFLAVILLIGGCSKEDSPENNNTSDEDDCIQGGGAGNGEVVAGRYIVLYKTSVGARGMTAERLNNIGVNVLQRNGISSKH